uniref:Transcription initiation factor TFIID subunit 14b n=1 Tax=Tanacetum cinerariifolium TaxID=118510 RepID=A0A6L2NVU1_TANCI|nr:transcription initiation factor TFIID subunit 14b [Tanacetum cinerariifolium]
MHFCVRKSRGYLSHRSSNEEPCARNTYLQSSTKTIKDLEVSVPIVYGTISFWLGRKATDTQTHSWTVYVRGATNEDLGVVIKKVGPLSTKKPVIVESYNEIVFPNPSDEFLARVVNHPSVILPRLPTTLNLPPAPIEDVHEKKRGDTKDHPLGKYFNRFSEADELLKLAEARQQVQSHIVKIKRRLRWAHLETSMFIFGVGAFRDGPERTQFNGLLNVLSNVALTASPDGWISNWTDSTSFSISEMRYIIDSSFVYSSGVHVRWNKNLPIKINRSGIDLNSVRCPVCDGDIKIPDRGSYLKFDFEMVEYKRLPQRHQRFNQVERHVNSQQAY